MILGRKSSQVTLANDDNNTAQASDPPDQSEDSVEARRDWQIRCLHLAGMLSQFPEPSSGRYNCWSHSLISLWTLIPDQLSPVLGVLKRPALCALWSLVMVSLMRTIRHRQQTPEAASPPHPHLFAVSRSTRLWTADTLTQNCSQLLPYKVVTDPGYSSTTQDRRITGTRFYQKITKTLMLSLHWLVV